MQLLYVSVLIVIFCEKKTATANIDNKFQLFVQF